MRPTILTQDLIKDVCTLVRRGNFQSTAALACGVKDGTLRHWKMRGKKDAVNGKWTIYAELYERLGVAEARAEIDMVGMVRDEPTGDRWLLSRRWREKFGNEIGVNLTPVEVIVTYAEEIKVNPAPTPHETGDSNSASE